MDTNTYAAALDYTAAIAKDEPHISHLTARLAKHLNIRFNAAAQIIGRMTDEDGVLASADTTGRREWLGWPE